MSNTLLVAVRATATGGRDGRIATEDGKLESRLAFPPELGGDGNGLSPEHLFAAGHAACFATSLRVVAQQAGIRLTEIRVTATASMLREPSGHYRLASELVVHAPELPASRAQELVDATHEVCMYSRALRGQADVTARVA